MIFNKDGTKFQITKHNPLMNNQEVWKDYKFKGEFGRILKSGREIQCWYLPVKIEKVKDDFYEEEFGKEVYGEKYLITVQLLEESGNKIVIKPSQDIGNAIILYSDKRYKIVSINRDRLTLISD